MIPPKFEVNEIHEIPNFDENFTDHEILVHNGCALWYVHVEAYEDDDERWINARLHYEENPLNLKFKIIYSIMFINNDEPAQNKKVVRDEIVDCEHYFPGDEISMDYVLKKNSGYLEKGVLKIQILFHMESIIVVGETSMFHFLSPPFNSWEKGHTMTFKPSGDQETIYCHHQMLKLHFKTISDAFKGSARNIGLDVPDCIKSVYFQGALQTLHGVFLDVKFDRDYSKILYSLRIAHYFEMNNVTRFMERQLVETRSKDEFLATLVSTAVEYKLEKLLKVMLRNCESMEDLARFLSVVDKKEKTDDDPGIDEMSSEAMKSVVAKFLSFD
ncbi:hypothetical protein CAEBREN_09930 [Caenorhabditis brenneri]|uniref:BTB domain-containing protein n=1 Tax=Caenorhabditis brenneri TaxID=135651 RepID=G0MUJ2_CAEBE|nr:hypothetical protein CAEBREN_09930 [Caenorhabditis brenneri]